MLTRTQAKAEEAQRRLIAAHAATDPSGKMTPHEAELAFRQMGKAELDERLFGAKAPKMTVKRLVPRRRKHGNRTSR